MKVAIVVGEASGDILGANLIKSIKRIDDDAEFIGVTGPLMEKAGCRSLSSFDPLAIMGIFEVLRHLPRLFKLRARLVSEIAAAKPDVMIGIDAPDFNLGLEKRLHAKGIKTVHYVSPSVWAWRQGRVKSMRAFIDHMFTLFPFEARFYEQENIPVTFVGHPLADEVPFDDNPYAARMRLGLPTNQRVVAVLPGSRSGEIKHLGRIFFEAIKQVHKKFPDTHFVIPVARPKLKPYLDAVAANYHELPVTFVAGQSRLVISASECVLVASGTATLETMLCGRPMVMAYKIAPLTYRLLKLMKLVKINKFALPNLLHDVETVPEFIQDQATADNIAGALSDLLNDQKKQENIKQAYQQIAESLRCDAGTIAAKKIMELVSCST